MIKTMLCASLFLVSCTTITPQNFSSTFYPKTSVSLLEINSFDIYKDGKTLHALISGLKTEKDNVQTIRYLNSTDNGKHWSSPVDIQNTLSSALATRGNDVQLAANGQNLVAIWQTQGEIPNSGALVSVYSHDAGKTWNAGKNPAVDNAGDQSHVDLIADKNGVFHTVWLADPEENGYQSLRYARSMDNGENWKPPIKLDDSSCSCCWNTLAVSPNDELHVLYRDMNPRDMTLLSSSDYGDLWQSKKTVGQFDWHFDGCPHVGGGITFDENNDFYASVWTGEVSKSGLYTVNSITNSPVKIGRNATHSDIAILENRVVVVWDEMSVEGTGIFTAQSVDKGATWSTPRRLSANSTNSTHPRIVASENNALILWTEKQPKQSNQWAMTWLN
ncbi:MAG: sialidase family protein [Methylococcales bacterium]|nr:sialidase family protein [Methylococcales bacterium]MDD5753701.1 sialidase family protein [Methylococcales bacterium]